MEQKKTPGAPTPMMHVLPGLPSSSFVKVLGKDRYVVHIEHATGATSLEVGREWIESLMNQCQEALRGLVLARTTNGI